MVVPSYSRLRLYISNNTYTIEPVDVGYSATSVRLVLRRDTDTIHFESTKSTSLGYYDDTLEIDGILGLVTLLAGDYLVVMTRKRHVGRLFPDSDHNVYVIEETKILPVRRSVIHLSESQRREESAYLSLLTRACNMGHMYFSPTWDLTSSTQVNFQRLADSPNSSSIPLWERTDRRFYWNYYLQSKLIKLSGSHPELHQFILPVMCGYIKIVMAELNRKVFQYTLVTRKRIDRVGTRYHSRGIDDQGHVSNYAETEHVVCYQVPVDMITHVHSYVQIRGSIPLYWRQKINSKYTPVLQVIQKPNSSKVFADHINEQLSIYGNNLVLINLINKKGYELPLGTQFKHQVDALNNKQVKYVHFDFHEECKKMRYDRLILLERQIANEMKAQGHFVCQLPRLGELKIHQLQKGVVRSNCIDCLDRTNVVQSVLAKSVLVQQLRDLGVLEGTTIEPGCPFDHQFKNMWADNADVVSLLYSGTGALKTDYTRTGKRTRVGLLNDGWNSSVRYIKNNFLDGYRQDAYDLFMGQYRPAETRTHPSPVIRSQLNHAHVLVVSIVVLGVATSMSGFLFGSDWSTVFRVWFGTALIVYFALAAVIHFNGKYLINLPSLVPIDSALDRQLGIASPN